MVKRSPGVVMLGSVKQPTGRATAVALQALLQRIEPDVIFLELPSVGVDAIVDDVPGDLETEAARAYDQQRPIQLVPVDIEKPQEDLANLRQGLVARVEVASAEYRGLRRTLGERVSAGGFEFMNSADCATLCTDIEAEMQRSVAGMDSPPLRAIYKAWRLAEDLRARAMLQYIEAYAKRYPFDNGVFLVDFTRRPAVAKHTRSGWRLGGRKLRWSVEWPVDTTVGRGNANIE